MVPISFFISVLSLIITTSLLGSLQASAACEIGGNVPPGSYQQSCAKCVTRGNDLSAICRKIANTYNSDNQTILNDYKSCRSDISNFDGFLTCLKGDRDAPNGSYMESCRNIVFNNNNLYAACRKVNGEWINASLAVQGCSYSIYNSDGVLSCNVPYGTYQRSCQNIRISGNLLVAECRTESGNWQNTSIDLACGRGIDNINGSLRCQ
jgi:hypothetical protein